MLDFSTFMTTAADLHTQLAPLPLLPKKRRFVHVLNPVNMPEGHELNRAQAVTYKTMQEAAVYARSASGALQIDLVATLFPQDAPAMPDGFVRLPDLSRTSQDVKAFGVPRELPLVYDILSQGYQYALQAGQADEEVFLIFTNVDIGMTPYAYSYVEWLLDKGLDALFINRRSTIDDYSGLADIPATMADHGVDHPGIDFFVFPVSMFAKFPAFDSVIGMPHVMRPLYFSIVAFAANPRLILDAHATFHIGDPRVTRVAKFEDYMSFNQAECLRIAQILCDEHGKYDKLHSFVQNTDEYRWIPEGVLGVTKQRPKDPFGIRVRRKLIDMLSAGLPDEGG